MHSTMGAKLRRCEIQERRDDVRVRMNMIMAEGACTAVWEHDRLAGLVEVGFHRSRTLCWPHFAMVESQFSYIRTPTIAPGEEYFQEEKY